jgi:hypothetical protein
MRQISTVGSGFAVFYFVEGSIADEKRQGEKASAPGSASNGA